MLLGTAILLACVRPSLAKSDRPANLPDKIDESYFHINDSALLQSFLHDLTEQFENGKTVKMEALRRQLVHNHGSVELPKMIMEEMTLPDLYRQCKNSVLIVGSIYMCKKCGKRHLNPASGFILTSSGAVVGMAVSTRPVYAKTHDNEPGSLQMVIEQYVPASVIHDLLTSDVGSKAEHPDSPRRLITRMEALERSGSWDTLENEVGIWITDHPNEPSTSIMVAARLMTKPSQESRRVGERIFRLILASDPNSIDGLRVLSKLLYSQRRYSEAVELYRQWLALAPNEVMVLNDLAWTLSEEMGQYEGAFELAEKALKLAPENMNLLDTHAVVCWHLKRYDEAEASLKEAIRVCREDGSVTRESVVYRFHLAEVYWESGRKEEAGSLFQECLGLQEKIGGLSPEQTAQAKRRCKEFSIISERPKDP